MYKNINDTIRDKLDTIGTKGEFMGEKCAQCARKLWQLFLTTVIVALFGPVYLICGFMEGLRK